MTERDWPLVIIDIAMLVAFAFAVVEFLTALYEDEDD